MAKAVISGVAGFLGSQLATALLDKEYEVVGLDNLYTGRLSNIEHLRDNHLFTFIETDVATEGVLALPQFEGVSEVYHLASPASPKFYQARALDTIAVNTVGTRNMLEIARRSHAKFLYTSTSEAYGDPEVHPQPEEYRGNVNTWGPRACYDEAKRLGEVFCYEYHQRFGVPVRVVRIFNTYSAGLRNDDGRVISNFVTQALHGDDMTIYGTGMQTRSFCYVDDLIRGLLLMMAKEEAVGEIINLGNPAEYTILDVAHMVKRLTGTASSFSFHPLPQDDPKVRRPNIAKARRLLGWEPVVSLEEGLTRTIEVYTKQFATA